MSLMKHLFSAELSASAGKRRLSIAFLDTGISPVEDFILPENRIVAFRDLINGKREPYDDNGHGTHVTGTESNFSQTKNPRLFPDEGFPGVQYELHLIGIDEGHRVSTVIVEHTKRCHQYDAAVQHTLYNFF